MSRSRTGASLWFSAGCAALLFQGCSLGDAREPDRDTSVPRSGGTLRLLYEAPNSLDPIDVQSVYESLPVNQIFDGLVELDASLNVVPALASTWTISRDGRTFTFHLRDGVRFHDGSPLTAADVVHTFERLLRAGNQTENIAVSYVLPLRGAAEFHDGKREDLPGIVAVDRLTVRIELERPYLSFLQALALDGLRIVPRDYLGRKGDDVLRRRPIGTGPFRLAGWDGDRLRLIANPDFYGQRPYLDSVVIHTPRDDERDQGAARFLAHQIDVVEPSADVLGRVMHDESVVIHRYQELTLNFLGMGTGTSLFDDPRVRRAVAHAVDRQALVAISPSTRRMAAGILPPGIPAYSPQDKALAFDPDLSRRLLAEAGHPGGRGLPPLALYAAATGNPAGRRTLDTVAGNLRAVGFDVRLKEVSWAELSRRTTDHDAEAFMLGWIADLADPDAFLRTLFEPGGAANYFSFRDDQAWKLVEQGASEMNPVERARIYRDLERRILDLAPLVPLFHAGGVVASRREVHGFVPGPLGVSSMNLEHVWIAASEGARP